MMTRSFSIQTDRVLLAKDGVAVFDTDVYPVQFFPAEHQINLTGHSIVYPDLIKGNAYAFARGLIGGDLYGSCHSYISIGPGEWGPVLEGQVAPTVELADEIIGTVPEGTDVLLVQVRLTRTDAPTAINGNIPPVLPQEGEYVNCPGGCLLVEFLYPLSRMLQIVLDGTNVILRRRQSVRLTPYSFWNDNNDSTQSGWSHGGTAGADGHPVHSREKKGPFYDPSGENYRRGGAEACSLSDPTNFGSTYSADIIVVPGRSDIVPDAGEFEESVSLSWMGRKTNTGTESSYTFIECGINFAAADRKVIVAVAGFNNYSGGKSINTLTVTPDVGDPVSLTRIIHREAVNSSDGNTERMAALFIGDVPDGTSATLKVGMSGSAVGCAIDWYVAYGLASDTAVATRSTSTGGSYYSLATADGGLAVACMSGEDAFKAEFYGIDNSFDQEVENNFWIGRGFQLTDGSTLSIKGGDGYAQGTGAHCWVAASFL